MKRLISAAVMVMFLFTTLVGCATTSSTSEKTAAGAGIGAVLGGIIGYATTGKASGALTGAAIGAAAGALTGFAIGKYEEKQVQTRKQVYREYPEYSKSSTAPEPAIKDLQPELMDVKNRPIESFTSGQPIKMVSEYTIVAAPDVKTVEVEENNYLIAPDRTTRTRDIVRKHQRGVERIVAKQTVTFKELLPGKYTHVAIVKIGDKIEQSEQTIEVAAMKSDTRQYAFRGTIK
jgi:hypothetical protein